MQSKELFINQESKIKLWKRLTKCKTCKDKKMISVSKLIYYLINMDYFTSTACAAFWCLEEFNCIYVALNHNKKVASRRLILKLKLKTNNNTETPTIR